MAYNPFNIFRRNQKVIFAVITVVIMFIFTLSSGVVGGDFFENFTQWLGSKGKRGDPLATLDGEKIYERDLEQVRRGRLMANRYMVLLAGTTIGNLDQVVDDQLTRMSPEGRSSMSRVLEAERDLPESRETVRRNPRIAPLLEQIGRSPAQLEQQMREGLNSIIQGPTMKAEDREVAEAKLAKLALQDFLILGGGEHYFAFAPNRTTRQQLEFLLWQKKADQLGIRFTTDDVGRLVRRELFRLTDQVQAAVQKRLTAEMPGFTMANCLKALGEEFRVRTAQVAVLGPDFHGGRGDKTYGAFPMFNPPYEAFEFFRDRCSPTTYAAIPVPAASLLAEVERRMALPPGHSERIAPPTDDELQTLFNKYKDSTPDPARETPGFKIPARVRVDWFQVTGEEPYYKAEAEKSLMVKVPESELLRANLLAVMGAQAFGAPAGQLAANAQWFLTDPLFAAAYGRQVAKHHDTLVDRYSSADVNFRRAPFDMPILDTSVVRPMNAGVAVAGMGGQLAGFGNTLAGLSMTATGPMAHEARDRTRAGVPAVLGMTPGPGMFNTALGGAVAYQVMLPKPLPVEAYRPDFLKNLTAERAKELAFGNNKGPGDPTRIAGDVNAFIEEVNKLSEKGTARDKAPVQKYIDEFLAKRGLAKRGNKTPLSEWDLERDPELAPLVAAQKESLRDPDNPHQNSYMPFGRDFFWEPTAGRRPAIGTFKAEEYPPRMSRFDSPDRTKYVVWRSEEVGATSVTFITAKGLGSVQTAWKRNKARELAKAMAEDLAKKIRESGKTAEDDLLPFVRDKAAELGPAFPRPFSIRGVCPLTTIQDNPTGKTIPSFALASTPESGVFHDFTLGPSENLKYPSQEFFNAIMDERTKPPGTTLVLTDAPKDTFLVVTLVKREEKTDADYKLQVASGGVSAIRGGPLVLDRFRRESGRSTERSAVGLLKLQFKYDETDEQKKKLDENEKRGGDS
jgi:hypothetical protein